MAFSFRAGSVPVARFHAFAFAASFVANAMKSHAAAAAGLSFATVRPQPESATNAFEPSSPGSGT